MSPVHTPLLIPDTMSRADLGPYMRSLREHYGLSQQDVSERLHIRAKYVRAIEDSQFDALPGKVYARGYVHTYAEFLGLDADQVVERCFGPDLPREQQPLYVPEPARRRFVFAVPTPWLAIVGILLLVMALYGALHRRDDRGEATVISNEVPEAILAEMRTLPMANGINRPCLEGEIGLACFYADRAVRRWIVPKPRPSYAGIDPFFAIDEQGDEE